MESATTAVRAISLVKTFGGRHGTPEVRALSGATLTISATGMTAIVGPSGCGKSTLLYALAGLDRPTSGQVFIENEDMTAASDEQLAALYRDAMGFVFQSFNLVSALNVQDNVTISDRLAGRRVDSERACSVLGILGLHGKSGARVATLSNGQQQRVALARVMYAQPRIVFADEPTGALDSANASAVLNQLRVYADGGRAVVVVTHDLEAACLADEVLVMRDGAIAQTLKAPTPAQLLPLINGSIAENRP